MDRDKLISAYVATVILVVLAVGIGVTLFVYFSGYFSEITGGAEKEQERILECVGARLDIDYYKSGTNLVIQAINIGTVELRGNFSIKVEHAGGTLSLINATSILRSGETLTHIVTGLAPGTKVTKVIITPLGNCPIPFAKVKEVIL